MLYDAMSLETYKGAHADQTATLVVVLTCSAEAMVHVVVLLVEAVAAEGLLVKHLLDGRKVRLIF